MEEHWRMEAEREAREKEGKDGAQNAGGPVKLNRKVSWSDEWGRFLNDALMDEALMRTRDLVGQRRPRRVQARLGLGRSPVRLEAVGQLPGERATPVHRLEIEGGLPLCNQGFVEVVEERCGLAGDVRHDRRLRGLLGGFGDSRLDRGDARRHARLKVVEDRRHGHRGMCESVIRDGMSCCVGDQT